MIAVVLLTVYLFWRIPRRPSLWAPREEHDAALKAKLDREIGEVSEKYDR